MYPAVSRRITWLLSRGTFQVGGGSQTVQQQEHSDPKVARTDGQWDAETNRA